MTTMNDMTPTLILLCVIPFAVLLVALVVRYVHLGRRYDVRRDE
jgi:hypothetical protein